MFPVKTTWLIKSLPVGRGRRPRPVWFGNTPPPQGFRKGKSKKSGKGLGLFITRHLVEGYGGLIWAEDRVPGHQEEGAAIHFTMNLAN